MCHFTDNKYTKVIIVTNVTKVICKCFDAMKTQADASAKAKTRAFFLVQHTCIVHAIIMYLSDSEDVAFVLL